MKIIWWLIVPLVDILLAQSKMACFVIFAEQMLESTIKQQISPQVSLSSNNLVIYAAIRLA